MQRLAGLSLSALAALLLLPLLLADSEAAAGNASSAFVAGEGAGNAALNGGNFSSAAMKEASPTLEDAPEDEAATGRPSVGVAGEDEEEYDEEEESFYSTTSGDLDDELLHEPIEATTYKAVQGAREEWRRRNAGSGRSHMSGKLVEILSDPVFWQSAACTFFVLLYLVSVQRQIYTLDVRRLCICATGIDSESGC